MTNLPPQALREVEIARLDWSLWQPLEVHGGPNGVLKIADDASRRPTTTGDPPYFRLQYTEDL